MNWGKGFSFVLGIAAFSLASNSTLATTLKTIYSFCSVANCGDGYYPGTLVMDPAGHLYGTAAYGGSAAGFAGRGTTFELIPGRHDKWSLGRRYVFCQGGSTCPDGENPQSSLVIDISGNLYGTTIQGGTGGTVFELVSQNNGAAWSLETLHSFAGSDGENPSSPLTYAGATSTNYYDGGSPLFGATLNGGAEETGGVVYQLTRSGDVWNATTLHDFSNDGYVQPNSNLLVSPSGLVYGQTSLGGVEGEGSIYALTQDNGSWNETILHSFANGDDDTYYPGGPLGLTGDGSLYGAATWGGPRCKYSHHVPTRCGGGLYRLDPNDGAWTFNSLYTFCQDGRLCRDGEWSTGGLIRTKSGSFYGVTNGGGANGSGVIFKISKSGRYEVLYSFCSEENCADGANPGGALMRGPHGRLYGTTTSGGANNAGTVFEFTP